LRQPSGVINKLYGRVLSSSSASKTLFTRDQAPCVCMAVFQSLTALAKNYTMRLLFVIGEVGHEEVLEWINADGMESHEAAMRELFKLRILEEISSKSGNKGGGGGGEDEEDDDEDEDSDDMDDGVDDEDLVVAIVHGSKSSSSSSRGKGSSGEDSSKPFRVNQYFRASLREALCNPREPWSNTAASASLGIDPQKPSLELLETTSKEKWDSLLRYLVGINSVDEVPKGGTIEMFVRHTGLMEEETTEAGRKKKNAKLKIVAKGYEYMLKSYSAQVWTFVFEAMKAAPSHEEALSLLFMLSYCQFGKAYPVEPLTQTQRQLLHTLTQLGIIYMAGPSADRFYPTSVSIDMIFALSQASTVDTRHSNPTGLEKEGVAVFGSSKIGGGGGGGEMELEADMLQPSSDLRIIVETNLQVVAYLTSELHFALLKLFVDFSVSLPNMAIGKITRAKAKEAFQSGITAEQIIDFLCVHAHPLVKAQRPIVPANVVDQLVLWQSERIRIKDEEAAVVSFGEIYGFTSSKFEQVLAYAERLKSVLWLDKERMILALTLEGFEQVSSFCAATFPERAR